MTDREAMKMALEALEEYCITRAITRPIASSDALRQALAQEQTKCPRCGEVNPAEIHTCSPQREQEPVAWVDTVWVERPDLAKEIQMNRLFSRCQLQDNQIPLYTAPPKREWVGLHLDDMPETYAGDRSFLEGAKWAEAKLKEKNND